MYVLDLDEVTPPPPDELPWIYSRHQVGLVGALGASGAIANDGNFTVAEVGGIRVGGAITDAYRPNPTLQGGLWLAGAQSTPLRYTVSLVGRFGARAALTNAVHHTVLVGDGLRVRGVTTEVGHYTVTLVGQLGFTGSNFGGGGGAATTPIFLLAPDQIVRLDEDGDDAIITIDIPLVVVDPGSAGYSTSLAGLLGLRGAMSTTVRYTATESGRLGFSGVVANELHNTIDLADGLRLGGFLSASLPGDYQGGLLLGGAVTNEVSYGIDLAGRIGFSALTSEELRAHLSLAGGLRFRGAQTDAVGYDLVLAGRLGLNGRLTLSTGVPQPFETDGLILTADGTAYYLVRRRRR